MDRIRKSVFFMLLCGFSTCGVWAQTQVIAHRGYWRTEGSAQNSIAALVKACELNVYGSELDVHLTADKQMVVNHDRVFKGVDVEKATGKVCRAVELDNGEPMPTFDEYLEAYKAADTKTRLIVEMKPLPSPELETELIQRMLEAVKRHGLENRVEYITFSNFAAKEFVRLAPKGTPVFPLNGDITPDEAKDYGMAGLDYAGSVYKAHPKWIEQCRQLGLKVNVWTIDDEVEMQHFINCGVDYITTNEPAKLLGVLKIGK